MSSTKTLLITPPMTQLNTPYPGTAYLCRYLRPKGYNLAQVDLGIELVHKIFSAQFLQTLFDRIDDNEEELSETATKVFQNRNRYIRTVESALAFMRGKQQTLANRINSRNFLPEGARFNVIDQLPSETFGEMSLADQAKFYTTLYLEDLAQFVNETASEHFECTRYAEKISASLPSFGPMKDQLESEPDSVTKLIIELFEQHLKKHQPSVVGLSVPFPGNLYAALICARHAKINYPEIQVIMGGGYVNTELRQLRDPDLFSYVDYVTLDDGEIPFERLIDTFDGKDVELCRTFHLVDGEVVYSGEKKSDQIEHDSSGWPDYDGLDMDLYLNTFDMANPMNRLWSDGRWNKLTIAHGCYWKRCTFCDVTLDYIGRYSEAPAEELCDRMEQVILQTGESGFHFVDEACPPALLKKLSLEIIKRGLQVTWWGNIRFEKAFTPDLAELMAEAGCIEVSGGLEVAEERLLKLIKKGTGIKQTFQAVTSFKAGGIMVHAYLMYGFPTQTNKETIEALETVRQLFAQKLLDSAFWHRFSLTAHSPIYQNPAKYGLEVIKNKAKGFAFNDVNFREVDNTTDHSLFAEGLRSAVYNFMHGQCLDMDVREWFDFKVPGSKAKKTMVSDYKQQVFSDQSKMSDKMQLVWIGHGEIYFYDNYATFETTDVEVTIDEELGEWLSHLLDQLDPESMVTCADFRSFYHDHFPAETYDDFLNSEIWKILRKSGLFLLA